MTLNPVSDTVCNLALYT